MNTGNPCRPQGKKPWLSKTVIGFCLFYTRILSLADVLAVFRAAPDVGIIGVLGARQLRTDGVFDHALGLVGRAVVHEEGTVRGKDIVEAYEVVQVLGGGVISRAFEPDEKEALL